MAKPTFPRPADSISQAARSRGELACSDVEWLRGHSSKQRVWFRITGSRGGDDPTRP